MFALLNSVIKSKKVLHVYHYEIFFLCTIWLCQKEMRKKSLPFGSVLTWLLLRIIQSLSFPHLWYWPWKEWTTIRTFLALLEKHTFCGRSRPSSQSPGTQWNSWETSLSQGISSWGRWTNCSDHFSFPLEYDSLSYTKIGYSNYPIWIWAFGTCS